MCIRIIGASNRRYAHIGDVIVAVIKEAVPNMPLERSEVVRAVIVRTCKELKRDNGMIIRYDDNAAVVIDQEGNPKGTRIFGAIARELRQLNFTKIVSLAPELIMGRDTVAEIITSIRNADMDKKRVVRITSTNITENIVKILLREDVRGRVVSWSSAGTCGFRGTRRGTPFAAQTAAANAIRTVVDQGQADTIGIAMRRALLGEIEGTCITRVKSEKVAHEYSTIAGIQESGSWICNCSRYRLTALCRNR
ncbi:uncharacterized protein LOC113758291 [Coffea eugenioides]|uniref:uncharacterized protein LOC113758291 n=1 Tax=Coffea eugenioides TaxID=49369 RepID=UPI000F610FE4|nr:uncharacterized protein LOC113758291 [Coffea eugenioides]